MKTRYPEPLEPLQLYVKRANGDLDPTERYACAHCGIVHRNKDEAYECCREKYCKECKKPLDRYVGYCGPCQSNRYEDRARKNAKEIPAASYTGALYEIESERFYEDWDEFWDRYDGIPKEEIPEFLFCCETRRLKDLSPRSFVESAISNVLDEFHEEAEEAEEQLVHEEELVAAVKAWLDKQHLESWFPDLIRKIKVPDHP